MSGLQDSIPKQPHVNRSKVTTTVKEDRSYGYGKNDRKFEVFIYKGEMEKIREWTLKKDNIETGGDLFGLWIDDHTAVVQFVLGPGVGSRRTTVSFYQDVNYLEKAGTYLTKHHGLCNIGQWHSHHRLSLSRPSGGDENTVRGNMPKLGMDKYIVFIANIESYVKANVNCFLFEIHNGCELPVLEGKFRALESSSPFRENKLVLDKALPGQEDYATDTRIANQHTKGNYTGDHDEELVESESKSGRTKHAEGHGNREDDVCDTKIENQTTMVTYIGDAVQNRGKRSIALSVNGLDHDENGKSESGSKHSTPRKQEIGEAHKVTITGDYIQPKEKVTQAYINNASNLTRERDESGITGDYIQPKEKVTQAYINNASNPTRERDESGFTYTDQAKELQMSSTKGEHTDVNSPQLCTGNSGPVVLAQPNSECRPGSCYDNVENNPSKTSMNEDTQVAQPSSARNSQEEAQHEQPGKKSRSKSCFFCLS